MSHPAQQCVDTIDAALKDVATTPTHFLDQTDRATLLVQLAELSSRLTALELRLAAASDDVPQDTGHRNLAAWLAHHTRNDYPAAARKTRLAAALDSRWNAVAAGLGDGSVQLTQAEVIVLSLDRLPDDVDREVGRDAESALVDYAATMTPRQLRVLGRRILDIVAPDVAEAHEARALEREEAQAMRRVEVLGRPLGNGSTRIEITTPDAVAGRFFTYLASYAAPRRDTGEETTRGDRSPYPTRLGRAFCQLVESIDPKRLPVHGGDATTVMVTIPLTSLQADLGVAQLSTGDRISAAEARRLACTASLIPAVLGTKGEVLDLGRTSRLFSPAQRKALRARHPECQAEGCSIPAAWCEAHHADPWSTGGPTDLANARLLCSWHHHRAHDPRYRTHQTAAGITFHRRQ